MGRVLQSSSLISCKLSGMFGARWDGELTAAQRLDLSFCQAVMAVLSSNPAINTLRVTGIQALLYTGVKTLLGKESSICTSAPMESSA